MMVLVMILPPFFINIELRDDSHYLSFYFLLTIRERQYKKKCKPKTRTRNNLYKLLELQWIIKVISKGERYKACYYSYFFSFRIFYKKKIKNNNILSFILALSSELKVKLMEKKKVLTFLIGCLFLKKKKS